MDCVEWLRWWRQGGRTALEEILLERWDPLGVGDDPALRDTFARWAVRVGVRLRHGVSAEELFDLLAAANRRLGVRVNERQIAAAAIEIRHWYRREQDDPPRPHWPVIHTERET
ncbi:MAG: hypothetical protein HOQ03_10035 [Thermoleophilia bacterium]|nr:hypothetical protein [Thermoleophilia bacterium]